MRSVPLLALAVLVGCVDGAPVDINEQAYPITDGVLDTGHPNVGLLLIDAQGGVAKSICTATVVGKKTLLTAAHCCKKNVNILFQLKVGQPLQVTKVIPHPSWTSLYKHDIGLAILQNPVTVTPAEAGTLAPATGMAITMVGYGRTSISVKDSGKKRKANNKIASVGSGFFTVTGTGGGVGNTCLGDSGGPTFTKVGGKEKLVGVISHSETTCGVKSYHATVKTYLSWLKTQAGGDIYPFPPPPKPDASVPKPDAAPPPKPDAAPPPKPDATPPPKPDATQPPKPDAATPPAGDASPPGSDATSPASEGGAVSDAVVVPEHRRLVRRDAE